MRAFKEDEAMIFAICYGKQTALREKATSGNFTGKSPVATVSIIMNPERDSFKSSANLHKLKKYINKFSKICACKRLKSRNFSRRDAERE